MRLSLTEQALVDYLGGDPSDSLRQYDRKGRRISAGEMALLKWGRPDYDRVGDTTLGPPDRPVRVSTVWLGLDHGWAYGARPLIFETMVFGYMGEDYTWRYSTLRQAEIGHRQVVRAVKAALRTPVPLVKRRKPRNRWR